MTGATRLALAEARWTAMLAAKPELDAAIALQRQLIGLVLDLSDRFEGQLPPRLSLPPRYVTTKLASGIPALKGEPIQVPAEAIRPTLVGLVRVLAEGGGGEATLAIRSAVEASQLDVAALLTLALRREQAALRAFATRSGLGHDLLWLVLDLAVAPYAHALLGSAFGAATEASPLRVALDSWSHGYCPLCGSWPALVEALGRTRRLRCSLCAAAWDVAGGACLYCGDSGERFGVVTPDPSRPRRVIETCGTCRGYTKIVDAEASTPFPLLALADLDSMDLDLAAMQRGCARPAVRQFARR
ncbi:MAG TPA: formate dehydrogenase accessory protein FdhE [Vicinamibacterales bacterium]|nr:formate dehydrogenase accessory protein FdhE [Vicinamibacterales bacterium]